MLRAKHTALGAGASAKGWWTTMQYTLPQYDYCSPEIYEGTKIGMANYSHHNKGKVHEYTEVNLHINCEL